MNIEDFAAIAIIATVALVVLAFAVRHAIEEFHLIPWCAICFVVAVLIGTGVFAWAVQHVARMLTAS